jgi:hypothetical protein
MQPTSLCSVYLMLHAYLRSNKCKFLVFGLTQSGFEPTFYRTREHDNQYTIDVVVLIKTAKQQTNSI